MGLLVGVGGHILLPLEGDSEAERCRGEACGSQWEGHRGGQRGKGLACSGTVRPVWLEEGTRGRGLVRLQELLKMTYPGRDGPHGTAHVEHESEMI